MGKGWMFNKKCCRDISFERELLIWSIPVEKEWLAAPYLVNLSVLIVWHPLYICQEDNGFVWVVEEERAEKVLTESRGVLIWYV